VEEESALLLAHASIELSPAASAVAALLHLDEPRAHALLGNSSSSDKIDGWCLNTGATHHMTDNGGEFTVTEFASYCVDEGVQRHYSTSYRPQQNSVVEQCNQMVVGMAQALLKQRGMHAVFWGEAVVTAVYILNCSLTKALNGRTPYKAWHGRKPAVSHLQVFGCLTFGKEFGHIGKFDDRSTPGVFIGYAEGSKAYRILDPGTQRVRTMRDVVFDEG
jgi:transposase InsO family protein